MRLERQQDLQKKHLRELREFAETFSSDKESEASLSERTSGERSSSMASDQSNTNASVGMMSL